jgi:DNA (cytosine-5)-methyltransferase 1
MRQWGGLYVIENVPGAPMPDAVTLCGPAMGLPHIRRHRLFESNAFLLSPGCACGKGAKYGVYGDHWDREGGWLRPDGTSRGLKATSIAHAQEVLGVPWMTEWDDLADCVPPAYSEYIGGQILDHLRAAA